MVFVTDQMLFIHIVRLLFLYFLEPYLEGVNPFIKSNKHRMIMFLDELGVCI